MISGLKVNNFIYFIKKNILLNKYIIMKNLLLSCDDYIYSKNGIYYVRDFGNVLIFRYLNVFDGIILLWRTKKIQENESLGIYTIPIVDNRIKVVPIPFFRGPIQYLSHLLSIYKVIIYNKENYSCAIFRLPSTIGFLVQSVVKKKNIPYAIEIVANPYEMSIQAKNILLKLLMKSWHYKQLKACKNAKGISYVTKHVLQETYPFYKYQFISSYSSVEMPDYYFHNEHHKNKDKTVLCHISQLNSISKGHLIVIQVVKCLVDDGYNVYAKFAGSGDLLSYFQEYAIKLGVANRIKFVGELDRKGINNFLETSDIMLFPSDSEGLPRVIIEAMAVGLPCVSSNVGGIIELLRQKDILKVSDVYGYVKRISELIDSSMDYEQSSFYSIKVASEFKTDILRKKRNKFYSKLSDITVS